MNPMLLDGKGFSAREVLYYQGEADSGENDRYTRAAYECELRGLITSYRRAFGKKLPSAADDVQLATTHISRTITK
jgi:hypothetical protein